MTNETKKRRLATISSITITDTTTSEQRLHFSNVKETQNTKDDFIQYDNDQLADICSSMKGDMTRIRRYASEIALHNRSTIELNPDGSILIKPRPRPPFPNEIISSIIKHLNTQQDSLYECVLVNKQFHKIANPLVWKLLTHPISKYHEKFVTWIPTASRKELELIGKRMHELRILDPFWMDATLIRLLPHIPRLKVLFMNDYCTKITDISLHHMPFYCQHLTSLELGYNRLTEISFFEIGRHCHQLCEFQWSIGEGQSAEWLQMFIPFCPLQRLLLKSQYVPLNENAMKIIQKLTLLTHLWITHEPVTDTKPLLRITPPPPPPPSSPTITSSKKTTNISITIDDSDDSSINDDNDNDDNQGTKSIPTTTTIPWPYLKTLVVKPSFYIDDATLVDFIKTHPFLDNIALRDAPKLTDISLMAIAEWLPGIQRVALDLSHGITLNGLRRFILDSSTNLVGFRPYTCPGNIIKAFPELKGSGVDTIIELDQHLIEKIRRLDRETSIVSIYSPSSSASSASASISTMSTTSTSPFADQQ